MHQVTSKCKASWAIIVALAALAASACGGSQPEADSAAAPGGVKRVAEVEDTIELFKEKDPTLEELFAKSAAYVVLPYIGEGGFIVGGAGGEGEAFVNGEYVGRVKLSEVSVGALVGGQTFSQLIFFEKLVHFERLKAGVYEFGSEVSAIAAHKGVAKNAVFEDGVVAFVLPRKGLMASASVGGQKLQFTPAK
jgi:lipid-binding SYLF domain-containing protein